MSADPQQVKQQLFKNCITKTFEKWQSLKIAIDQTTLPSLQFVTWLINSMETFFYQNAQLEDSEVADWLDDILDTELDTRIEDGTVEQVCNRLCTYFTLISQDKLDEANALLEANMNVPVAPISFKNDDSDSSDSSD